MMRLFPSHTEADNLSEESQKGKVKPVFCYSLSHLLNLLCLREHEWFGLGVDTNLHCWPLNYDVVCSRGWRQKLCFCFSAFLTYMLSDYWWTLIVIRSAFHRQDLFSASPQRHTWYFHHLLSHHVAVKSISNYGIWNCLCLLDCLVRLYSIAEKKKGDVISDFFFFFFYILKFSDCVFH